METKRPVVPDDYPQTADLDGKTVNLRQAVATMQPHEIPLLVVDIPGKGKGRPWRYFYDDVDFAEDDNGELGLP